MAGATVSPLARFPLFSSMGIPVIHANQPFILAAQSACLTYMPYPDGQGDVIWEGNEFGLTAPDGANVTLVEISVTHRVSNTAAYPSVTAQVYAGGSPVGSPKAFTPSISLITETITVTSGISASALSSLAVQLKFHSVAMGLAYVHQAYATANYSFADAVGIITVAGSAAVPGPAVSVTLPWLTLVSLGPESGSLAPSFGQSTTAGDMLAGWVYSNSASSTFDTACSDESWTLAGHGGGAYSWLSLWYKLECGAGETAPGFSTPATVPMSQLAEFAGIKALDQFGGASGTSSYAVTASGPDSASGDLVIAVFAWAGPNTGPTTLTLAGDDSAGNPLPLAVTDNAASPGSSFFAFGWAQAGQPFAPSADTVTGTLGLYAGSAAVIASFTPAGLAAPPPMAPRAPAPRLMGGRVVVIPVRFG